MGRTPKFTVSWEEYIDNLLEENKRLQRMLGEKMNKIIAWEIEKAVKQIYKTTQEQDLLMENAELKKELHLIKMRVKHNDELIDELLVAEEWTDVQWILDKNYEFTHFNYTEDVESK